MAASLLSSKRLESDQREIRVNSNERLQQKITTIKGNAHMIVVSFIGWNEGETNKNKAQTQYHLISLYFPVLSMKGQNKSV